MPANRCGLCGRPPLGQAAHGDHPYCHEGPSPTCYEAAQGDDEALWAEAVRLRKDVEETMAWAGRRGARAGRRARDRLIEEAHR